MEPSFWHQRWAQGQIGFHEGQANALLVRHFATLNLAQGARVFVPLCGKTRDIAWLLAQGHRVVGAELSPLAIEQLFAELGVAPKITPIGSLTLFSAEGVDIFVGDIFDLTRDLLGPVDAIHDRAALVALPPDLRARYAAQLVALTGGVQQLLTCFEYDQTKMNGPPFSIDAAEVARLYDQPYTLTLLERAAVTNGVRSIPADEAIWHLH